jgi:hypothetical protein
MRIVTFALGGSLVLLAGTGQAGDAVPSYTNDDLDRIAPRRAETGVASVPAVSATPPGKWQAPVGAHDEAYWRREAEHLRDQLRPLEQRALALRLRIEHPAPKKAPRPAPQPSARRRQLHPAPAATPDPTAALREQLHTLEEEIRDREARLEERARREGALPGWLR